MGAKSTAAVLALATMIVAALVPAPTSLAEVAGTGGRAVHVGAPASVAVGALESDDTITVFDEEHDVTLAAPVAVDAVDPGTYTAPVAPPPIAAGARVDAYLLHGDKASEGPSAVVLDGSATFSTDVLGVIFTGPSLHASDGPLGSATTLYPTEQARGLEGQDAVTISADRRTVTVHLQVFDVVDQVRVVTVADPIPGVLRDGAVDRDDPGGRPPAQQETDIEPVRDGLFETEAPTPEPEGTGEPIPGTYIVTFRPGTAGGRDLSERLVRDNGGELLHVYEHALSGFVAKLNEQRLEGLLRNPNVERVEQDTVMGVAAEEELPWGLDRLNRRYLPLGKAYLPKRTGAGITVYVLDTGIKSTHSEFEGRVRVASDDCHGHGTHTAGIVGGKSVGVAQKADLMSRRVFDCTGTGPVSAVIKQLDWIHAYGKRPAVIVLSFEGDSVTLDETLRKVIRGGITAVVAAGNSGKDACTTSPARVAEAITVGATSSADQIAPYSNQGTCIDLFAPGSTITSAGIATDTAKHVLSGTSAAAAHVAGVAALYLEAFPTKSPAEVAKAIVDAATNERLINRKLGSTNKMAYAHTPVEQVAPPPLKVVNDGFEDGPGVGWAEWSSGGFRIVVSGTKSKTGAYGSWLGGYNNAIDRLEQRITSVPDGASMRFSWLMVTNETAPTAYDTLELRIFDGLTGQHIATRTRLSNLSAKGTWTEATADLSAFAGRSIHVRFVVRTDAARATTFALDDIRLAHP